jgi:ABC-type uncharacterized transport system ATPase subunit
LNFRKIGLSAINDLGLRSLSVTELENKAGPNHSREKMLYIEGFSFSYNNRQSLTIPSLKLPQNTVIGILGFNEAGKPHLPDAFAGWRNRQRACCAITTGNTIQNKD